MSGRPHRALLLRLPEDLVGNAVLRSRGLGAAGLVHGADFYFFKVQLLVHGSLTAPLLLPSSHCSAPAKIIVVPTS